MQGRLCGKLITNVSDLYIPNINLRGRLCYELITAKIDESPTKEEVSGGQTYDETDAEDDRKIQTVRTFLFRLFTPNPYHYEGEVRCYPEHRYYMINLNTFLDSHWEEYKILD